MTWHVALRLGRVSNLPTVTSNVLAAIALSSARASWPVVVLVCVAMSLMYVAGMYLNDFFDREIDARERPDRPIPSGQVTALTVLGAGFALLGAGVLLITGVSIATGAGWAPIGSVLVLAALIVGYDLHHKRNRLGPLIMGLCRVGVYTTAALATGGWLDTSLALGCAALLAYLIGLTYVARQENLRELTNLWPLGFLGIPFVIAFPHGFQAIALYLVFAWWTVHSVRLVTMRRIRDAVTSLIAGISLLDALIIADLDQPVMAAAALGAFALTRHFQRSIPGT